MKKLILFYILLTTIVYSQPTNSVISFIEVVNGKERLATVRTDKPLPVKIEGGEINVSSGEAVSSSFDTTAQHYNNLLSKEILTKVNDVLTKATSLETKATSIVTNTTNLVTKADTAAQRYNNLLTLETLPMNFTKTFAQNLTTASVALTAYACRQVDITIDFAYTGVAYVGSTGLTTTNGIPLKAGDVATFYVKNTNEIFVLGSIAGTSTIRVKYSGRQ
jgi:CxxC motif-containing protein